ncbi:MAG: transketolase [Acidimicrobiia bacterium]|nr:transketolase [Acidimicrobiia bacterium]
MSSELRTPEVDDLEMLARRLRIDSIIPTTAAGSGHPTSAISAADLAAVLFTRHFRFDVNNPGRLDNDRFVLSKGHAAPLLYAVLAAFGLIDRDRLTTLREAGSPLQGHPVPTLPMVDVATGSLGQGLSNGLGLAIGQQMRSFDSRTWVLLGDSEMAEGSVWEAIELAGVRGVGNLTAIVDLNRLGQRGETMHGWDGSSFLERGKALGWMAIEVDGHDVVAIDRAMTEAINADAPTLLVARTIKGKGVSFVEDDPDGHGKAFSSEEQERALEQLGSGPDATWPFLDSPSGDPPNRPPPPTFETEVTYEKGVATRDAFGAALTAWVTDDGSVVVIDGEVGDSTRTEAVDDEHPGRFIQGYIAEQNMVGMASGLQTLEFHPVVATFGAFFTRAHDFIRMAAVGNATMTLVGSHAGVSIGEDGPSQMALEDIAMMRSSGAVVLYPSDGNSAQALLKLALNQQGLSYLRTTRGKTPHLYVPGTEFSLGGSHLHRSSGDDLVTVVAAGVTVFEALDASQRMETDGIGVRVLDLYSVSPPDISTLSRCLSETRVLIVVEDHRGPGGIAETVTRALMEVGEVTGRIVSLAVSGMPGSATPVEQRREAGIDSDAIVDTIRKLVGVKTARAST